MDKNELEEYVRNIYKPSNINTSIEKANKRLARKVDMEHKGDYMVLYFDTEKVKDLYVFENVRPNDIPFDHSISTSCLILLMAEDRPKFKRKEDYIAAVNLSIKLCEETGTGDKLILSQ